MGERSPLRLLVCAFLIKLALLGPREIDRKRCAGMTILSVICICHSYPSVEYRVDVGEHLRLDSEK